jgi:hypothetical protein
MVLLKDRILNLYTLPEEFDRKTFTKEMLDPKLFPVIVIMPFRAGLEDVGLREVIVGVLADKLLSV